MTYQEFKFYQSIIGSQEGLTIKDFIVFVKSFKG